jgi:D-amino-acid dehydrogenase
VLDPKQTAALDPNVLMDIAGSVYFPKDCHLSPRQFIAALEALLEELGARFLWEHDITGWRASGNRIDSVRTRSGT